MPAFQQFQQQTIPTNYTSYTTSGEPVLLQQQQVPQSFDFLKQQQQQQFSGFAPVQPVSQIKYQKPSTEQYAKPQPQFYVAPPQPIIEQPVPVSQPIQQEEPQMEERKLNNADFFGMDANQFLDNLSHVLTEISVSGNDIPLTQQCQRLTGFHHKKVPQVTIRRYLERIVKYAQCSGECYILSLVYLDRLVQQNPTFFISSFNIHRLLMTSVMVAIKFFDDKYYNNAYYAKVGGINTKEMNKLELEFLQMIDYNLHVDRQTYEQYKSELVTPAAPTSDIAMVDVSQDYTPVSAQQVYSTVASTTMNSLPRVQQPFFVPQQKNYSSY